MQMKRYNWMISCIWSPVPGGWGGEIGWWYTKAVLVWAVHPSTRTDPAVYPRQGMLGGEILVSP